MNVSSSMVLEREVDQLLAGEGSPQDIAALRDRVEKDALFAARVASTQRLNKAIGAQFAAPPSLPAALEALLVSDFRHEVYAAPLESTGRLRIRPNRRVLLAIAAVVMIAFSAWQFVPLFRSEVYQQPQWMPMDRVYIDLLDSGFTPDWLCKTDEEFVQTFSAEYGQGLLMSQEFGEVECLGLTYANTLSNHSACVLVNVGGERVLVVIDRLERDSGIPPKIADGIHIHRKELGKLVLYELSSSFAEERVLSRFSLP